MYRDIRYGFDCHETLNNIDKLKDEIEVERQKSDEDYNPQKEFELLYKQFIQGLKLNTGIKLF